MALSDQLTLIASQTRLNATKLLASDAAERSLFGCSVTLDGETMVVGSYGDPSWGNKPGAAYVFVLGEFGWAEQAKLNASDAASRDHFGYSVAIDGGDLSVGAPGWYGSNEGAYVFVWCLW